MFLISSGIEIFRSFCVVGNSSKLPITQKMLREVRIACMNERQ